MDFVDTCVVGAGVVGLAIARRLAAEAGDLVVLDQEPHYGQGVSSRNSEVIHAGIYYPRGSLKARFCVEGKQQLYEYCGDHAVNFARCGKLIVATSDDEAESLEGIRTSAFNNGVSDLTWLDAAQVRQLEPEVNAVAALLSPSTGIVSAHEFMTSLMGDVEDRGGVFAPATKVVSVQVVAGGFAITTLSNGVEYEFGARCLVNAAGLGAQAVSRNIDAIDAASVPELHLCKGNYFAYTGKQCFQRLIYPVPEKSGAGLGVHATIDLGGQVKFGPDVEYVADEEYRVSEHRVEDFFTAVRRYFPGLKAGQLVPAYSGIRPKVQGPGTPAADFVIEGPKTHGVNGLVQLFGIESPGLTSSLAIADHVAELLAP